MDLLERFPGLISLAFLDRTLKIAPVRFSPGLLPIQKSYHVQSLALGSLLLFSVSFVRTAFMIYRREWTVVL